jgi:hypothetical protein
VLGELLADYKKPSPDLVTNIRSLGGVRNKELIASIGESRKKSETFVRIMKNFAYIKSQPPGSVPPPQGTVAPAAIPAPGPGTAVPAGLDDNSEAVEVEPLP